MIQIDSKTADYTALPELQCTFGGRSIVPDVAVIAWNRINLNELGEPEDDFTEAPDWTIEILSPDQKVNRVIDNILHCLKYGSQLGWMLDPDDYSVLTFTPQQEPEVCRSDRQLKIIAGVQLTLTPQQIFHQALLNSPNIKRIYLDELTPEQAAASVGIRLMQLTILPEPQMASEAREIIARVQQTPPDILTASEIIEIVTTIVVYKFTTLSREEVEAMLGLTGTTLEETRVYREAKEEGLQQGQDVRPTDPINKPALPAF